MKACGPCTVVFAQKFDNPRIGLRNDADAPDAEYQDNNKNNKKKNILGSLYSLKIERNGKIHSDKQRYTKNPVFLMDFKKVKKYLTIEDNVLERIKMLKVINRLQDNYALVLI